MSMEKKLGAFVLGVAGLFGGHELLSKPKNDGVEKPSIASSSSDSGTIPRIVKGELPPLFEEASLGEEDAVADGQVDEDSDSVKENEADRTQRYTELKEGIKKYLFGCREMPEGMDPELFYKTLNPGDEFIQTSESGSLSVKRFVAAAEKGVPSQTTKILEIKVETTEDGLQEYTYTSGIALRADDFEEDRGEKAVFMGSDIDPTAEEVNLALQKYTEIEQLNRSVDAPINFSGTIEEKVAALQGRNTMIENLIKYCDELEQDGNPHLALDGQAREYYRQKIDHNKILIEGIQNQG